MAVVAKFMFQPTTGNCQSALLRSTKPRRSSSACWAASEAAGSCFVKSSQLRRTGNKIEIRRSLSQIIYTLGNIAVPPNRKHWDSVNSRSCNFFNDPRMSSYFMSISHPCLIFSMFVVNLLQHPWKSGQRSRLSKGYEYQTDRRVPQLSSECDKFSLDS